MSTDAVWPFLRELTPDLGKINDVKIEGTCFVVYFELTKKGERKLQDYRAGELLI